MPEDQAEIIVCANNFHGRTITIVGFSTEPQYRDGFGPFTPGFKIVPFGDAEALEKAITPNTVAFLVEPIQGEAGVIIPPAGYLRERPRDLHREQRAPDPDEIQTGLGRTGKLLAEEHEGVEADMTLIGKALSGGFYPVSAVLSNKENLGVFQPGDHGSTFGGNPLACAVARAALRVHRRGGHGRERGGAGRVLCWTACAPLRSPAVKEVRGRGLMLGGRVASGRGRRAALLRGAAAARHPVQGRA